VREQAGAWQCCGRFLVEDSREERSIGLTTDLSSVSDSNFGKVAGPLIIKVWNS